MPIEKVIPRLLILTLLISFIYTISQMSLVEALNLSDKKVTLNFGRRLLLNSLDNSIFLTVWLLIYYAYHYFERVNRQQVDTHRLNAVVKDLELKTIKSHINPHFIFNALNSIRALVDENPERARKAITELSNILRNSMQAEKMETVPLENELNIVRDYLALEQMRFEERLKVDFEIDEDTLDQPGHP
jgi:sensor histidine kinase YesM